MSSIRFALAGILSLLTIATATAQQFPTVQDHSVIGRIGVVGQSGPSQAIPFATLAAQIGAVTATRNINTTAPLAGGGSLAGDRTLSITANGIDNTLIRQSGGLSLVGRSANSTGNVADISAVAASSCAFIESASTIICGQLATAGIANNAVDNTKIRQSAALSLVGRSANSTGNVADISATAGSSCVFMESSSSLACGAITTASIAANAVTFAKFQTIAALSMFGNCTNATANGAAVTGTANQVLRVNGAGTSCGFGAIDLSQAAAATGTLQTASVPAFAGGDVTAAGGSLVLTIGANAVTNAKMATMAANTVKGNATGGSAVPTDIAPATARSSSLLNIDQMTTHGDSIYTILSTDRVVATSAAFTASRAWTLPAASAMNPGQSILITDLAGGVTPTNTLVITRAGADTINGGTTATIAVANGAYYLVSDGVSKWSAQSIGAASGGGVSAVTCGTGLSGGTITTSGTCTVQSHVLLNTLTASSSATLSDTTSLTATYSVYEIIFENIIPATVNTTLELQVHSGGSFQATGYAGTTLFVGGATNVINTATFIQLSGTSLVQNTASGALSGFVRIPTPSGTSTNKQISGVTSNFNGTLTNTNTIGGIWNSSAAIDGFQVLMSSGNITSGVIKIYGIQ